MDLLVKEQCLILLKFNDTFFSTSSHLKNNVNFNSDHLYSMPKYLRIPFGIANVLDYFLKALKSLFDILYLARIR